MVYLAYLGKQYGISKIAVVVIGIVTVSLGCHSYFNSPWVKNNVHTICKVIDELNANGSTLPTPTEQIEVTCPNIVLEKVFIVIVIFCVTLSALGLIGNLFSKQLSDPGFKIADVCYNGAAGLFVIIGGSLFLYSTVAIENLFKDLSEKVPCTSDLISNGEYQLYTEKIIAGAFSILQGILHFVTSALLIFR